jgi:hypothetical protein
MDSQAKKNAFQRHVWSLREKGQAHFLACNKDNNWYEIGDKEVYDRFNEYFIFDTGSECARRAQSDCHSHNLRNTRRSDFVPLSSNDAEGYLSRRTAKFRKLISDKYQMSEDGNNHLPKKRVSGSIDCDCSTNAKVSDTIILYARQQIFLHQCCIFRGCRDCSDLALIKSLQSDKIRSNLTAIPVKDDDEHNLHSVDKVLEDESNGFIFTDHDIDVLIGFYHQYLCITATTTGM